MSRQKLSVCLAGSKSLSPISYSTKGTMLNQPHQTQSDWDNSSRSWPYMRPCWNWTLNRKSTGYKRKLKGKSSLEDCNTKDKYHSRLDSLPTPPPMPILLHLPLTTDQQDRLPLLL